MNARPPPAAARPAGRLPVFTSLRGYRRDWLRRDAVAGLTVWAVLVPESLAYASIAGVSPVVGLYAAPAALVFYAALGSSRLLVVGPMSATAALSAATIAQFATQGSGPFATLTATLAVTTGVIGLAAGIARLGFVAQFISEPVLKGFIIGLALTILAGQLPKLFGVPKSSGDFFEQVWGLLGHLGGTHVLTLVIGLVSLGLVLGLRRIAPVVPGSLVAVAFGIGAVALFGLDQRGVAVVGHVDRGLPPIGLPSRRPSDYAQLAPGAVGVLLVGFAEGLAAAKAYAARHHSDVAPDRELLGVGAANVAAGLVSGMVVSGSLSKTAVNVAAGARSQVSGLVVAGLTVVTLLFLTGLFEGLPEATLAAVVIAAVVELVDVGSLVALGRVYTGALGRIYGPAARVDLIAALAALVGVLVFDTLPGLVIGIAASLLTLLYRASRPHVAVLGRAPGADVFVDVERQPDSVEVPGVLIVRVESGLFFANADNVRDRIRDLAARPGTTAVVLDAQTVPSVDVTAARMLYQLADDLERGGRRFYLARDVGQVRDVLRRARSDGPAWRFYPTVRQAVAAATASGS